jgi:hypothetical protein
VSGVLVLGLVFVVIAGLLWAFPLRRYTGSGLRGLGRRENWERESSSVVWGYRAGLVAVFTVLFALVVMRA